MPVVLDILQRKVFPHLRLISAAGYLAGFFCLCIFPNFDRRTEVEEHGLIGNAYAASGFGIPWPAELRSLIGELSKIESPTEALATGLKDAGFEGHWMNFTTPGGLASSLAYTVAPSRRGDSREGLVAVFTCPLSKKTTQKEQSCAWTLSIGIMLAKYLKTVQWLSRDVIIVFADGSLPYGAGIRAWLAAYFGGTSAIRRGVLRQAVVLETIDTPTSFLAEVEGVNGIVPNQDLVNTFFNYAHKLKCPTHHRGAWASVFHTFNNGGVHSSHAPFLELQIPAFTLKGQRRPNEKRITSPENVVRSLEGLLRSLSNNLQQLHHSFNFYFFTAWDRHISNGLYLYPVFAMQLPLIFFKTPRPAFRDIRAFLVGLGALAAVVLVSASPIFLLATNEDFGTAARKAFQLEPGALGPPPTCIDPALDPTDARRTVVKWLAAGGLGGTIVALVLRQFAFRVFDAKDAEKAGPDQANSDPLLKPDRKGKSVRLSIPLWDAICCSSAMAAVYLLAPVTIYSWALAMPLTTLLVPPLLAIHPFDLRRAPFSTLFSAAFLAVNLFFFLVPPNQRAQLLGFTANEAAQSATAYYFTQIVPIVPAEARKFLPTSLMEWIKRGELAAMFDSDLLVRFYEAARDYNCIGGLLFPAVCCIYLPFIMLLIIVGLVLPAQNVEEGGLTIRQLRLFCLLVLGLVAAAVVGGVYWRSHSSSGLGTLEW